MSAESLDQVKEHLYKGLAIIDVAGHVDDPGTLWRRDSLAYAMRRVFKEWQAAHALLSRLEDERPGEQPRATSEDHHTQGGGARQARGSGGGCVVG